MAYILGDTITGPVLQKDGTRPAVTVKLENEYQVWWYNKNYPGFAVTPATPASVPGPK